MLDQRLLLHSKSTHFDIKKVLLNRNIGVF